MCSMRSLAQGIAPNNINLLLASHHLLRLCMYKRKNTFSLFTVLYHLQAYVVCLSNHKLHLIHISGVCHVTFFMYSSCTGNTSTKFFAFSMLGGSVLICSSGALIIQIMKNNNRQQDFMVAWVAMSDFDWEKNALWDFLKWGFQSEMAFYLSNTVSLCFYVDCLFRNLKHIHLKAKRNHIFTGKGPEINIKAKCGRKERNTNWKQIQIFQFKTH